jgi:hypothetical protein
MKICYAVKKDRKALIHQMNYQVTSQVHQAVIHHHVHQIVTHTNRRASNHNRTKEKKRKLRKNIKRRN